MRTKEGAGGGFEAPHDRQTGEVDEARELLLCVRMNNLVRVGPGEGRVIGTHTYTELYVGHHRAQRSSKIRRIVDAPDDERCCDVRDLLRTRACWTGPPKAMIACSRNSFTWH